MRAIALCLRLGLFVLLLAPVACDCGGEPSPVKVCQKHSDCPSGQECDPDKKICVTAFSYYCDVNEDCVVYGEDYYCESSVHRCVSHNECGPDNPCPTDQECILHEQSGYYVCIYPGCESDDECIQELAGQCDDGERARCFARECVCRDACGGPCGDGRVCCAELSPSCIDAPAHCAALQCDAGYGGVATTEMPWSVDACAYVGDECACQELPALPLGDIGDPSVMQLDNSFQPVFAAYNFGFVEHSVYEQIRYGDLMLGRLAQNGQIDWVFVDGVPDVLPDAGPHGPRTGIVDPGEDVGRELDMAIDASGRAHIAYWDRSNHTLRYARQIAVEGGFIAFDVDVEGETGRYPSMALDPTSGAPRISYLSSRVDVAANGAESRLRLAVASIAEPMSAADFVLHNAHVFDLTTLPCEGVCPEGEVCQDAADGAVDFCVVEQDAADCVAECGTSQACVAGNCVDVVAAPLTEVAVTGVGLFSRILVLADGSLRIIAYDAVAGDLVVIVPQLGANLNQPGALFELHRLDGHSPAVDLGRELHAVVGAADNIYMSYVDVSNHAIISARLTVQLQILDRQLVDDGRRPGPHGAMDRHVLADPAIAVASDGSRVLIFQDATVQSLWRCDATAGQAFAPCHWLRGGEPGAYYDGSYGFSNNVVFAPATTEPILSSYRFVPMSGAEYANGVVVMGHPASSLCEDDAYEDNDSNGNAALYQGVPMPGRICADDVDWFAFAVAGSGQLEVRLRSVAASGNLDIVLYDPSGTELGRSNSAQDNEIIEQQINSAGTYAVLVQGASGISNDYILSVDF